MCLTIPAKIISINNNQAKVKLGSAEKDIDCSFLGIIKKGDYVIVQNNFAINKISKKEAQEILRSFEKGGQHE